MIDGPALVGPHNEWPDDWNRLLGVDFDGAESGPDAVVAAGLDDPRHIDRVPPLTASVQETQAAPIERLYAAVALTTWGEKAGYRAVVDAAIPTSARNAASRSSTVSFARLEWAVGSGPVDRVAAHVEDVVQRGVRRLQDGDAPAFDLPTQLVDLTAALVKSDDATAVHLATEVITAAPNGRALLHAAELVARGAGAASLEFADHLGSIGDDDGVRRRVARALELRRPPPGAGPA